MKLIKNYKLDPVFKMSKQRLRCRFAIKLIVNLKQAYKDFAQSNTEEDRGLLAGREQRATCSSGYEISSKTFKVISEIIPENNFKFF